MTVVRKFGWKKDKVDLRDFKFKVSEHHALKLPPLVDLRPGCPPVYDQGDLGSCTANALAALCQYDEIAEKKISSPTPSRLFIYWNERVIEGTTNEDSGAELRDGIKALQRWGFPSEALWPYDTNQFTVQPPSSVFQAAASEKISKYLRVHQDLTTVKATLAQGHPIAIGFQVFASFQSDAVAQTGIVPLPQPGEEQLSGHAVAIVGYDDSKQWFIVRNSWGNWGDSGYFYVPYSYFLNPNLASDLWSILFVP